MPFFIAGLKKNLNKFLPSQLAMALAYLWSTSLIDKIAS